jgi:hypothetical protein
MPTGTPSLDGWLGIDAVRDARAEETGAVFVPPFDDAEIVDDGLIEAPAR